MAGKRDVIGEDFEKIVGDSNCPGGRLCTGWACMGGMRPLLGGPCRYCCTKWWNPRTRWEVIRFFQYSLETSLTAAPPDPPNWSLLLQGRFLTRR